MSELVPAVTGAAPLDRNPVAVYLARLAPGSRRTMRGALTTMAGLLAPGTDPLALPWHQLRYQHTAALRSLLAERYAAATANKHLAALRGVLRECARLELMSADDCRRACDLEPVKAARLPRGRALGAGELRALFAACADGTAAGARDAAMLAVLYGCGLRRSELVALDVVDWDAAEESLTVRAGKGNKARLVYVGNGAALLRAWLAVRGPEPGPLFRPINRHGTIARRRLSDQAVLAILRKRGDEAGVARFSPHDLRRSMISDLLDAGADISVIQKIAGHASVTTTQRYDRRGEDAKRRAAALLRVPHAA